MIAMFEKVRRRFRIDMDELALHRSTNQTSGHKGIIPILRSSKDPLTASNYGHFKSPVYFPSTFPRSPYQCTFGYRGYVAFKVVSGAPNQRYYTVRTFLYQSLANDLAD